MRVNQVVGFAENAFAFVLTDTQLYSRVRGIYLFGSAARGELGRTSDIDLFFDCDADDEVFVKRRAEAGIQRFYSSKDYFKWKLLGIKNPISVQAGNIKEWELWHSVQAEGILLFSKAIAETEYKRKLLLILELPRKKAAYLRVTRALFGRPEQKSQGLVQSLGGEKISTNVAIIPQTSLQEIQTILVKENISFRIKDFLSPD